MMPFIDTHVTFFASAMARSVPKRRLAYAVTALTKARLSTPASANRPTTPPTDTGCRRDRRCLTMKRAIAR
ncbi:MAG: hypothetical protein ACXV3B_11385 [Ilumatobacteraceae bacterium]